MKLADPIPFVQFMLESERNLRVAEAVHKYYEDARQELVVRFFQRLGTSLTKQLGAWKYEYHTPFFTEKYGAFDTWKPAWKGRYRVRIEAYNFGERMIYGIWRDEQKIGGRPFSPQLLSAVKKAIPAAEVKVRKWYEAEITMRSPAADWRPSEVLWRLHGDQSFLEDVSNHVVEVAQITATIIDSIVAKGVKA